MASNGMNLSETFKLTKGQCYFSPNGRYIANSSQFRLVVREFETLQIVSVLTCIDSIDKIVWAPNSKTILSSCFKRGVSQIWTVQSSSCACKLEEGSSGLVDAVWCPDSKQLLTWSEFGVRINVWSLNHKTVSYIQNPKLNSAGCIFYKTFAVICERKGREDYINIFKYSDWTLMCNFKVNTDDLDSCNVVNDAILVCDTHLAPQYFVYDFKGSCLTKVLLYQNKLGVKCLSISLSEQFAALGCYDGTCKLLNSVTWSVLKEWKHSLDALSKNTIIYEEQCSESGSRFVIKESTESLELPYVKANHDDPYLLVGIGLAVFSTSGRYLATRCDAVPSVVWVWDMQDLSLISLVIHSSPVVTLCWDPLSPGDTDEVLAMCCNADHIYIWSCSGMLAVKVPNCETLSGAGELGPIRNISWSGKGNCLILKGDYHFCLCYFPDYCKDK